MKNYQRVFHTKGIFYVVMSMILVLVGIVVLFSLASCTQELFHEHSWGEGEITKSATCTEPGEKTYTCGCGEKKTETIPATGHDWEITEAPDFMVSGNMTSTCTACGETVTEFFNHGAGTENDPYLIISEADWNAFAEYTVEEQCDSLYFKLTDDISVSKMASAYMNDSHSRPFLGKLDGGGHTITLSLDSTVLEGGGREWNDGLALFMSGGDGCVIKNLTVTGTINTDRKYAAGFISRVVDGANVVIENCRSNVTINSSVSGDATTGGFIAVVRKNGVNLTFNNCMFDGNFISESGTNFSGFVGFQHDDGGTTLTFSGCAVVLGEQTSERLKTDENSRTFCRTDPSVVINTANSLYTTALGSADRGTLAYLSQANAASALAENEAVDSATIFGKTLYYAVAI